MSDENRNDPHDTDDFRQTIDAAPETPRKWDGWSRKAMLGGALAGLVIGAGILAVTGSGFARGGPGGFMHGYAEYRLEKVLDEVDASKEQTDRVKAIFERTRSEVRPMFGDFRDMRDQFAALIEAPTIDREAIEKLRAERVAAIDTASRRVASAIAEAAEVLTPEQRKELVEEMREHSHRRW